MDTDALHLPHGGAQIIERDALGIEQRQQFVQRQVRRGHFDQRGGGHHQVARRENDLSAVAFQGVHLFARFGMKAIGGVFVTLGEEIGLKILDIFDGRRVVVHDDVIHDF